MEKINFKKGFTLIELLVVIAIIGILTGIVIVSITGVRNRAYDAEIKQEISQIRTDAEVYYNDNNGSYSGYTVPTTFAPPACSTDSSYRVNISSTGDSIAIYADLCGVTGSYCVDSSGFSGIINTPPAANSGRCQP